MSIPSKTLTTSQSAQRHNTNSRRPQRSVVRLLQASQSRTTPHKLDHIVPLWFWCFLSSVLDQESQERNALSGSTFEAKKHVHHEPPECNDLQVDWRHVRTFCHHVERSYSMISPDGREHNAALSSLLGRNEIGQWTDGHPPERKRPRR